MLEQPRENRAPSAPLYSELPYPADGVLRTPQARILLWGIKRHAPRLLDRRPLRIVDIGCGTGETTVGVARVFPAAEVVGADVNPASLELARGLARRVGSSARFVQCDITVDLAQRLHEASPGPFDVVCSLGALHHLADPKVGFSAVRQIIRRDGLFYCFVYSHFGRREEMAVKSLLNEILPASSSWKTRADALNRLRLTNLHTLFNSLKRVPRRLQFGPPLLPLELLRALWHRNRLVHESDTYSNPCEHLYRFAELRSLLIETGWEFLALARRGPSHHARGTYAAAGRTGGSARVRRGRAVRLPCVLLQGVGFQLLLPAERNDGRRRHRMMVFIIAANSARR